MDRPQSPQSMILAGQVLSLVGSDDLVALISGNDVLGGNFLSRINMDLRETKGWSYGVRELPGSYETSAAVLPQLKALRIPVTVIGE